ncbi:TrlF family AAA-like ATPase [uncultured Algoriphagus sp.]|uniref:TrlF family AAA-like ATPase n=1 Tax=uncultured Algoriphagus sp. TaxID=417365 RepID=UPI0030EC3299|tara:strand:+ start:17443 stop:20250 length:2808 start_codon:yes stop_codon:yes gene_type:complete
MQNDILFKGARWYKCDLHLHTTSSLCFLDKTVTAKQWVDRAIEQGLDCVAVTDHNSSLGISSIQDAARGTKLVVFPGVEITCDTSKIHLLILFDPSKGEEDVKSFLSKCDIEYTQYGQQDATTTKSVFEIADIATARSGALIIPAHIDEYAGLNTLSAQNLEKFYSRDDINAVQVVHKEFLDTSLQTSGNTDLKSFLNNYYNNPNPQIDDSFLKAWFTPVKYALENQLAILTFSDNPHEPKNPKHGLWGIGRRFTWIKMDECPSLEGLRQAFLLPDYRIKNDFDSNDTPYTKPNLWIKSISILNTTITEEKIPLIIDFNPQLNTLIGGRGSGKSSILRFIRGVFNKTSDLNELKEILEDHNEFYKKVSGRQKKGVLTDESIIEIEFIRNEVPHKIIASNITDSKAQTINIQKRNEEGIWEDIKDEGYIDFFEFEHYSQKQIYEIAQEPNALRERIDRAIEGLEKIKIDREHIKKLFLEKSAAIRTADVVIAGKGKIETRIKDLEANIKKLQQSGIASLLKAKETYTNQDHLINAFRSEIEDRKNQIDQLAQNIKIEDFDTTIFNQTHEVELKSASKIVIAEFENIKKSLEKLKEEVVQINSGFEKSINTSQWKKDLTRTSEEFFQKREELEKDGIDSISSFERFSMEKSELEIELENIIAKNETRKFDKKERERLRDEYLRLSKEITDLRQKFVKGVLVGDKVKVNIKPFRNKVDFEARLRTILQRENTSFQSDVDALVELCFNGNVENKIKDLRSIFLKIKENKDVGSIVSGFFVNLVRTLNDAQIDEIELMLPEDEIEIQYKPTATSTFRSLSTASAGQKTTAILTFILSYGRLPLILDQPEDDLDNRLVYELIVDRLKQAKERRQLIVVTHNANVPVNGDAEFIVSMDTESNTLKVLHSGTVEQAAIKKEICDVMEGGETAFEMRSKRYKSN